MCDSCPNLSEEKGFLGRCFWWPFAGTPIASTEESGTALPEMKLPVRHPSGVDCSSGVVFGMVGTAAEFLTIILSLNHIDE